MRAVLIALCLAGPAQAFERMTLADCENGWAALAEAVSGFTIGIDREAAADTRLQMARMVPELTADGWCVLTGGGAGLEEASFDSLRWQAEGLDAFINDNIPPLAVRIALDRARADNDLPVGFDLTVRQVPGAGLLLVERMSLRDNAGDLLNLTAVLQGAYFSTMANAASSLGGISLSQMAARVHVGPDRGWNVDRQEAKVFVGDLLDGLDGGQLDTASRNALSELRRALPDAKGVADVTFTSERGLGWLQVTMAQAFNPDATQAEIIGFALTGTTLSVDWQPQ